MKKALITGGNGFVGKTIVQRLLAQNVECKVIGRGHYPQLEKMGVECIQGNICDTELVTKVTEGIDTVFHVAALAGIWGKWQDFYTTNVLGTRSIIEACRGRVSSLVYTSTPSVVFDRHSLCGDDENLPYAKDCLCHYAKSKIIAEKEILAANSDELTTTAIRPHLVWGPGDPHLIPRLIESRQQNRLKRVGRGDNLVDISYVDNVAHAHLLAAQDHKKDLKSAGKAYFISQGAPVNLWEWLNMVFERLGVAQVSQSVSLPVAYSVGAILEGYYKLTHKKGEPPMTRFVAEQLAKSHYFSIERARRDIGYEPLVSTAEGLDRLVESYQR